MHVSILILLVELTSLHTSYPAYAHLAFVNSIEDLLDKQPKCNDELLMGVFTDDRIIRNYIATFENKSNSHQQIRDQSEIKYEGMLYVVIMFCETPHDNPSNAILWLYGYLSFYNTAGFLNSGDFKFIPIYFVFFFCCTILLLSYGVLMYLKKSQIGRIHSTYYTLVIFQTIEVFLVLLNAITENRLGEEWKHLNLIFIVFFTLRNTFTFIFLSLFSTGIRYKQALISEVSNRFKALVIVFCVTCPIYLFAKQEFGSKIIPIMILSSLLGCVSVQAEILVYWLINTFKTSAEELVNTKEAAIMRLLFNLRVILIVLAGLIIPGVIIEMMMIYQRVNNQYKKWKFENKFYWQFLSFLLLLTVGVLMRPEKPENEVSVSFNENAPDNSRSIDIGASEVRKGTAIDISNLHKDEIVLDA